MLRQRQNKHISYRCKNIITLSLLVAVNGYVAESCSCFRKRLAEMCHSWSAIYNMTTQHFKCGNIVNYILKNILCLTIIIIIICIAYSTQRMFCFCVLSRTQSVCTCTQVKCSPYNTLAIVLFFQVQMFATN